MDLLREKLEDGEKWKSETTRKTFSQMGMTQWYNELNHRIREEETMNWDSWKDFMVAKWMTLFLEELPMVF